tara:strand:- start:1179 stop:2864 length:1686 start_codon:yes stop_codon:yes gene_type:complete
MAGLLTLPFFDVGAGISPADGALLYFNVVGSETDKSTYTTAAATVAHANPVVADSKGVFPAIYLVGDYDWVLTDKNLVQQNTGSVSELATSTSAAFPKNFATLALAVANTNLVDGDALNIAERTTGNGGGAMWDVVLSSTVTENTYDIVQCVGVATLSLVLRVGSFVYVDQFGTTAAAAQRAADRGAEDSTVVLPEGVFTLDTTVTLTKQQHIKGAGRRATSLQVNADIVAIVAPFSFSKISDMTVTTDGITAHTKDLIQIGQVGGGGRTVVDNIIAKLAGQDGVHLINGNLTVFRDVTATANGRDGVHLSLEDVDANACVFDGIVDCNGNGRDGVHLADAISSGDALAPNTCTGNIIAQNNGRYGVNIGSHKNDLTIYAETNTTRDINFGAEARGNMITTVETTTFNDASANGNQISFHNLDTLKIRGFLWPVRMNEGFVVGDSSFTGYSELKQTGNQDYTFAVDGTSSNQVVNFVNNRATFSCTFNFEGSIVPLDASVYSLGTQALPYSQVYTDYLTITDGVAIPSASVGVARMYIDVADGDLKIKFGDGTIKTIVTDT